MAKPNPKAELIRKESINDVVHDLELLFLDEYGTVTSKRRGRERRDEKIQELMETNGTLHKGYKRILKDLKQTRNRRHILKEYYEKVKDILEETAVISKTEKSDFLSKADEYIADLKNKRYTVLIAGETGAGKSSLINLILNDHVLPTRIKPNTHTICEISYGPKKEAVIHFSKHSKAPRTLTGDKFENIKEYIEMPLDAECYCERIEIKILNALLKGGVVIVDSPGICDSEHVSKIALKYLPQAYAFIYVINSSNAGGLQKDRVGKTLYSYGAFPRPRLMDGGELLKKTNNMLGELAYSQHIHTWKPAWISGELCNLSDQVKGEMRNANQNGEERLKKREEVEGKLEKLKQGIPIREIEDAISQHVKHIRQKMTSHLQSDEVRRTFCTWSDKDMPDIDDCHKTNAIKIKETYSRCIEERFQSFLQNWENREKLFTKAHADLERRFHQGFFEFEKDIRDIDRVLVGESDDEIMPFGVRPGRLCSPLDPRMKKFLVLTLGVFMPFLIPVGLAAGIISAPVFGYLVIERHLKEQQLKNKSIQALIELSSEFLEAFIQDNIHRHVLDKFSKETNHIASFKRCHQQLITKYEQRCKDLTRSEDEARDKETLEKYGPFHGKLQEMNQELMFDAIQNGIQVMSRQIDVRQLPYNCDEKVKLGEGTYGTVFKGRLTPLGQKERDVAVKKLPKPPEPSNVATFLREAYMLKKLEHKHIIFFYGVAMNVCNHKLLSLELVFELCTGSLKSHIIENDKHIPWKSVSAVADTLQWTKQILDALEFIHSKDVVHRDLKLDNILISSQNHIKVADLGLAKYKNTITGTECGTILYMAPEVHEGKSYCNKVDMYSFGLIMWEMWFGKRVFSELSYLNLSRSEFLRRIKEGNYRPQTPIGDGRFTPNPPPAQWTELMESCWQTEPSLRRTATECKDLIEEINM